MDRKITDMAAFRAARTHSIADACRWSDAFETIALTNLRVGFAWQRMVLRAWGLA